MSSTTDSADRRPESSADQAVRFATLIENLPIGIFRSTPGPKGRFVEVNPALQAILGYSSREELFSIDISSIYADPTERQRFSLKLSTDGYVKNEELSYIRKDGTPIIVSETAIVVRDANGDITFFDGIVQDITERKRIHEEILVQKTFFEQLFNGAPEAIVLHDTNDRVMNINNEFVRMFGYTREEAIGRPLNDLVAPQEFADEAAFLSDQVTHGTQVETESQRRRKDGKLIDVSILGAPIMHHGTQIGVYAIYRDITARKKAENEVRLQKTYFERLFNSAPEAIALHSSEDRIANINQEFTELFGYSLAEAIGKQINSLIVPDERQNEGAEISRRVLSGERLELETVRKRKDGTQFHVSILGAPIIHEGRQVGDYAIYRDITQRKKAEEELLVQKAYWERLFNAAPEAIVLHDSNDRVMSINEEFTRMFGYTREEAIGQLINDLVAPEKLRNEAEVLSHQVVSGNRVEAESRRRRKDGTLIDVSILGAPVMHGEKQIGVYAIYRDITEKKHAEEARIRSQEEARLARNIQVNLLPKEDPHVPGYDIAGRNMPALNVGGDYYDVIWLDEHRLAIALGDVSGKGIAASLVMANVQATIRGQMLFDPDPQNCLTRANTLLYRSTDARTFISLFFGVLDTRTHSFLYANAGQDPPIVISTDGTVRTLTTRGIALGIKEQVTFEKAETFLKPGDRILIYSDGLPEAMDLLQVEFGEERLQEAFRRCGDMRSSHAINSIIAEVQRHANGAPQSDDMTVLVIKRAQN